MGWAHIVVVLSAMASSALAVVVPHHSVGRSGHQFASLTLPASSRVSFLLRMRCVMPPVFFLNMLCNEFSDR